MATGFSIEIDTAVVFAYAKEYKQNPIKILETVKMIQQNIKERS